MKRTVPVWCFLLALLAWGDVPAQVLDKRRLLETETFWDNRDWDWYEANIPFFECPDPEITTTYYYRWELLTKHLTYGSPASGYSFTEFIDRPFWSGAYGAISCPAGHQLYEARWLRSPRFARDYARYWMLTPGAQPRRYSTWLADSVWALHRVHPNRAFALALLPALMRNQAGWEERHFVPEQGLFWQIGHDDGMEFNIASRQTRDIVRGAPGFRPAFNAYMWAEYQALARMAELGNDSAAAAGYRQKAQALKEKVQSRLWDPGREFFFQRFRDDEERDGFRVRAGTLTYETGQFAGSPHGREESGYVPWQFSLPDPGYEAAWKFLMNPDYFLAEFGPTTVERHDPLFVLKESCCWWSGQSWPYATTQTLKGMANLLQRYDQAEVTAEDYFTLLRTYALSHRKDGRPYLAEALHPDTGSFKGHDGYNHSEHYFHSGFTDLVISGLVGVVPGDDSSVEIHPLAPHSWDYFALDDLPYRGYRLAVLWDRAGERYGRGPGLHVLADGRVLSSGKTLERIVVRLPEERQVEEPKLKANYAVNNDGEYYPRLTASHVAPGSFVGKANDGNYWYHLHPPNRWSCAGSTNREDALELDLGVARRVDEIALYFLDDGTGIVPPARYEIEFWDGAGWRRVPGQRRTPAEPTGHRANRVAFPTLQLRKARITFLHAPEGRTGLTEFELWGEGEQPYVAPAPPDGNLALNRSGEGFPRATCSFHDQYGGLPERAIDGRTVYSPSPMNRWTAYGSSHDEDWLEVDFGKPETVGRVVLHIYDDRGGVQPPASYRIEYFADNDWREPAKVRKTPEQPAGGTANTVTFSPVTAAKVRVVFVHAGKPRSGVTELEIWKE